MELLEFKRTKNYVCLKIDKPLDLWHLQGLINKGDLLTAKTVRTIFVFKNGKKEKAKRKLVTLTIKVEKVAFSKIINKLRVKGMIVEGPEEVPTGSYHTIQIGLGSIVKLEKREWKKEHLEILAEAKADIKYIKTQKLLKEFLTHIHRDDGLAVYGLEDVKIAANLGAIKTVIIPEGMIEIEEIRTLIKTIESKRGKIRLLKRGDPITKKFYKSYKIGAILRFRIR